MSPAIVIRSLARAMAASAAARWLVVLALAACSAGSIGGTSGDVVGPSGSAAQSRTNLETDAACRQQVNQMVEAQNRPEIYAANSSANSPYSANSSVGVTSHGLAGQFAYGQTLAACESNAGTGPDVESPAQNTIPPGAKVP